MNHRRKPDFMGVPVRWNVAGEGNVSPPSPAQIAPGVADVALWAEWPFPTSSWGNKGGYRVGKGFTFKDGYFDDQPGFITNGMLRELAIQQCMLRDGQPDYYFGFLGDDDLPWANVGFRGAAPAKPAHQAFGWAAPTSKLTVYAHELGHNFGNDHTGGDIRQVGWDVVGAMRSFFPDRFVRPTSLSKLMNDEPGTTGNGQRWVDVRDDHYEDVLESSFPYAPFKYGGVCRDKFPEVFEPQFLMSGILGGDGSMSSTIEPVFEEVDTFDTTPVTGERGGIILRDAQAQILYQTTFDFQAGTGESEFYLVPVTAVQGTDTIELYRDGQLQTSRVRSATAPTIQVQAPWSGQTLRSTVIFKWNSEDGDGDQVYTYAMYSPDGAKWIPLEGVLGGNEYFTISTEDLPSSSNGIIRVMVSDGMNTTAQDITNLVLGPDRPPALHILTPADNSTYNSGENVPFLAQAHDLESGWLGGDDISWSSSLDGNLGVGDLNLNTLSVGQHVITAQTAGPGPDASAQVHIKIRGP